MAATVVNDMVMVPADVIKQRLKVSQGQYHELVTNASELSHMLMS